MTHPADLAHTTRLAIAYLSLDYGVPHLRPLTSRPDDPTPIYDELRDEMGDL